jgi:hypothetical protein
VLAFPARPAVLKREGIDPDAEVGMPPDWRDGPQLALWHDLVRDGEQHAGVELGESVQSYLVFVLMRYLRDSALAGHVLALDWLAAAEQTGRARADALRDVGDRCLLVAGRFPGLAERRRVSADYFATLGSGAYLGVAESATAGHAALFAELAGAFRRMVRVLGALPRQGDPVLSLAWADALGTQGRGH